MNINQLYQLYKQSQCISTDTRILKKDSIFFCLKGQNFDGNRFAGDALKSGASYVVIDDEKYYKNNRYILVKDVLDTIQQLAIYHRKLINIPIIAITGTNGKTTSKELINTILSKKFKTVATQGNLNNHIGVPLTILSIKQNTEIAVIEMGANHIGEIGNLCKIVQPDFGIISNIGRAHLEGFGSFEGVIKAKTELYKYISDNKGITFVNLDNKLLDDLSRGMCRITYGTTDNVNCKANLLEMNPYLKLTWNHKDNIPITIQSQLIGKYNFENILAAICIGSYFNVNAEDIKSAIECYIPSNNRSQIIHTSKNNIILDAYNANPTSMELAIQNFGELNYQNKIAIIGDMLELGNKSIEEHKKIIELLKNKIFDKIILVGDIFSSINSDYDTFRNADMVINWLKNNTISSASILIKGSRGIKLEKLIEFL